jgi:hypothetical protein
VKVYVNFFDDVRERLLGELRRAGYTIPKAWPRKRVKGAPPGAPFDSNSAEDVAILYFNVRHRAIAPAVRPVFHSREFKNEQGTYSEQTQLALLEIQRRSIAGESLLPFHHRALTDHPEYHDGLLNEWGMHHLHLGGIAPEQDGYTPRSGAVLCVVARSDALYFVRVHPHQAWSDYVLIEIVHQNWPHLLSDDRAVGFSTRGEDALAPEQHQRMRDAGLTMLTTMKDGTVYVPPGGGYSTSGHSSAVLRRADRLLDRAQHLQRHVEEHAADYASEIRKIRGIDVTELHFELELESDGMVIVETETLVRFPVDRAPR